MARCDSRDYFNKWRYFIIFKNSGGWGTVIANAQAENQAAMLYVFNITPTEILIYLLTLSFFQFIRQDVWQRIWAAKSLKTAQTSYWISMIIAVALGAIVVAIGIFSRFELNLGDIDPTLVYYHVINDVFPFSFVILMIVALLAAVISTADSFFIAGSSSIVNDIIKPNIQDTSQINLLFYSRISVLIVSLVALLLALMIPGLVNLMVTGTAMAVSGLLAPVILGMFWEKPTNIAGVTAMWIGLGSSVIWTLLSHPFNLHPIMIGLPLSLVTLLIVTFTTQNLKRLSKN